MKDVRLPPQEIEHLFAAGWAALQSGMLSEAEEAFLGVLAGDPRHADALNGLGTIAFHEKRLDDAEEMHAKALKEALKAFNGRMPTHVEWDAPHDRSLLRALHGLALAAYRRGDTKEAERRFEELLKLNPKDNTGAKFLLADIKKGRKRWDEHA
ncbi:MAG: tetratricopeptide repeat protein [Patescibacteria group bacterium]